MIEFRGGVALSRTFAVLTSFVGLFGFAAGATGHHLINRSDKEATYLEVGDRSDGDEVSYPSDDLQAVLGPDRKWIFAHKDGTPY